MNEYAYSALSAPLGFAFGTGERRYCLGQSEKPVFLISGPFLTDADYGTWKSGPLIRAVVLTDIHQMS